MAQSGHKQQQLPRRQSELETGSGRPELGRPGKLQAPFHPLALDRLARHAECV